MEVSDRYSSIAGPSEGVYREKGSKFIALAYPVHSVKKAEEIIRSLKKEYHDARHHCYAYRLGADKSTFRSNDDGEPSNSAGKPILGQIQSRDLSNVLIVVVRYFGGTLLGVGGLINAYRSAAADALDRAVIISKTENKQITLEFEYPEMNSIMKIIKENKLRIVEQDMAGKCHIRLSIPKNMIPPMLERLNKIEGVLAVQDKEKL